MATKPSKKAGNKKPSKKSSAKPQSLTAAIKSGDIQAALLAASVAASADETKKAVILGCIASTFLSQGFPQINNPQARIPWGLIPRDIVITIGNGVTLCINGQGFNCPPLAPAFDTLRQMGRVSVVGSLVDTIAAMVTP